MHLDLFTHRVLPMKDKLFRFAFRLLQNRQEAEDAVQDVLVKVWAKRAEWGNWENMEGYCMVMTRNLCLERLRVKKGRWVREDAAVPLRSPEKDPAERLQDKDMVGRVRRCVETLPEQQQLIMHLREGEGLTYQEVAARLGLSLEQVKVYLHRARTAVRNTIKGEEV